MKTDMVTGTNDQFSRNGLLRVLDIDLEVIVIIQPALGVRQ